MYFVVVGTTLLVLPVASIVIELLWVDSGAPAVVVVGRWFVFWAVGVRLLLAGLRQIVQPRYTAETILGIKDEGSLVVVRELGFANLAISAVGVGSLVAHAWVTPAATAGAIFYGLAGVNHVGRHERNTLENVAMVSDLFMLGVLAAYCPCDGGSVRAHLTE